MSKRRLDIELVRRGLVPTRSQAESYIKLGDVKVDGTVIAKPGFLVRDTAAVELTAKEQYVSRAALKLASVAQILHLDFTNKIVLDVGSSTGGFTDYALKQGAEKVIAVEVGKNQLHPSLRGHAKIELYEQTDIRQLVISSDSERSQQPPGTLPGFLPRIKSGVAMTGMPDIVVADVSFISLREILPHISKLCAAHTEIVTMVKPQFEAEQSNLKHKGVIKNDRMRRAILKDFEDWARRYYVIVNKADSDVRGAKGNQERFYLLKKAPTVWRVAPVLGS